MSKSKVKSGKNFSVYLPDHLNKALELMVKHEQSTKSEVIQSALWYYIVDHIEMFEGATEELRFELEKEIAKLKIDAMNQNEWGNVRDLLKDKLKKD